MSDKVTRLNLKTSNVTVIISLSFVLFMVSLMGWILLNTGKLTRHFKENIGFQIFLKENATNAEIEKLRKELDAADYVKTAVYKSKEEAAEEMKKETGDDFVSFLGFNPLPVAITVNLKAEYANPDSVSWIEKDFTSNRIVREVVYQKALVENVNNNMRKIGLAILFFAVILMVIAVALINNTIRLSIYSKRFLIRTMYLVGATQAFIRKPFIIKGVKNGVIAGIIAVLMVVGFIVVTSRYIPDLLVIQDENMLALLFILTIIAGVLVSGLSSALSVRKYLRLKADDLYF